WLAKCYAVDRRVMEPRQKTHSCKAASQAQSPSSDDPLPDRPHRSAQAPSKRVGNGSALVLQGPFTGMSAPEMVSGAVFLAAAHADTATEQLVKASRSSGPDALLSRG